MVFEFDQNKSKTNKLKHGIDFEKAQMLWEDSERIIIPAKDVAETRYLLIGKIDEKHWSTIYTIRDNKIRIISVRRSRNEEKEIYEN